MSEVSRGTTLIAGIAMTLMTASVCSAPSGELPARGICAHRGAGQTHPENTLPALLEARRLGAHMLEFDVRLTGDGELAVIHDATVDRTTDGSGEVSGFTAGELKRLDAGAWKDPRFRGVRIPTLAETLKALAGDVWLNINLKGGGERLGRLASEEIRRQGRLHQSFLACGQAEARGAREAEPLVRICNLERTDSPHRYVEETLKMKADRIQLKARSVPYLDELLPRLKRAGVGINFCCTDSPDTLRMLYAAGVEFVLVDSLARSLRVAEEVGIPRLQSR